MNQYLQKTKACQFVISKQFICNSGSLVLEVLSAGHQNGHPNDEVYLSHAWMHELMDSRHALKKLSASHDCYQK
jgi:hypothetical protein